MQRNLDALADCEFDVLVIGGGASGAATAREATLRGLRTALIERDDFGGGASAHCFKVVHGGIRYLQHGDVRRLRASCGERSAFLRIAPHLVAPLPFAIPTYGWGRSSKWFLGTGMRVYDALSADRNAGITDKSRQVPGTRFIGRDRTIELFPFVERNKLTGAAIFDDGQMYNPPRLVLALVNAAVARGALVANYVGAERFLMEGNRVVGVRVRDHVGNVPFDIRARLVINAAGPWAEGLLETLPARDRTEPGTYSRDACFVVNRRFHPTMAIAIQGRTRDADALLARATRHLFLVPWRDRTLVGVWHKVVTREPDQVALERSELLQFIEETNAGCPGLALSEADVCISGFGLVPFGKVAQQGAGSLSFGKESRLIDHWQRDRLAGLITLVSVRYTVARMDAAAALDLACRQLGVDASTRESLSARVPGADFEDFEAFLAGCQRNRPSWLTATATESLVRNYGSLIDKVLAPARSNPALQGLLPGSDVCFAEVLYVIREEMAVHMSDIVFRRTNLGTGGHPGGPALAGLQEFLQQHCDWDRSRVENERAAVDRHYARYFQLPSGAPAVNGSLGRSR
jgi:glycerol-3-phosphate dehydrogenase